MKPIGQTFYIDEPATGVPGVFITRIDLFFKKVSSLQGIELQIRTTTNGVPTGERLPFGSKKVYPSEKISAPYILGGTSVTRSVVAASEDASVYTPFIFETPVFVESGKSYALVLLPLGGNPDYQVWTMNLTNGLKDVTTKTLITDNNDTGDLFLSSNDRDWIPVITEDLKFIIYIADFTASSGSAVIHSPNEEYVELTGVIGDFANNVGEPVYPTTNTFTYNSGNYKTPVNVITVASPHGTFVVGDNVKQIDEDELSDDYGLTTVTGKIYSVSGSILKISNITGNFEADKSIIKVSDSNVNAVVSSSPTPPKVNVETTLNSNVVSVPDTTIFNVDDYICIATNTHSYSQITKITIINLTSSTIQCLDTITFRDTQANYYKLYGNGNLAGNLGAFFVYPDFPRIIIDNSTATELVNFTGSVGGRLVGQISGSSATIHDVVDFPYNQISPQISHVNMPYPDTGITWAFKGIEDISLTKDSSSINIHEGRSNEFIDRERVIMSRSNEFAYLPSGRKGERTVNIFASLSTTNTMISPVIDAEMKLSTFTRNLCEPDSKLTGYYLNINTLNGNFSSGASIEQSSTTGKVLFSNSSYMVVNDVPLTKSFQANSTTVKVTGTSTINAVISSAEYFSEALDNGYFRASRYISKTVLLADTQNSEDMFAFLGAYRPSGTNLNVYAKIQHNQDSEIWENKHWSKLLELTPPSLLSSQVDINDQVELKLSFPASFNLFTTTTGCNPPVSGFATSGTAGQFTCDPSDLHVGDIITITGTLNISATGSIGSYVSGNQYVVYSTSGTYPDITGFTLKTLNGDTITTIAGTLTDLIFTTSSIYVTTFNTADLSVGQFVYLADNNSTSFNVRQIISIPSTSIFVVDEAPSFVSSDSKLGVIPDIISKSGAFLYDQNNNIVRYVTDNDIYFDAFSKFAIKIVPTAVSPAIVPRVGDLRVLALQA
jgi:hypothetical protein